jgi:hypothetical protein
MTNSYNSSPSTGSPALRASCLYWYAGCKRRRTMTMNCSALLLSLHSGIHPHPHSPPCHRFRGSAVRTKALSILLHSAMHTTHSTASRMLSPSSTPARAPRSRRSRQHPHPSPARGRYGPSERRDPGGPSERLHIPMGPVRTDPFRLKPAALRSRCATGGAGGVLDASTQHAKKRKANAMQWKSVLERSPLDDMEHPRQQRHQQE